MFNFALLRRTDVQINHTVSKRSRCTFFPSPNVWGGVFSSFSIFLDMNEDDIHEYSHNNGCYFYSMKVILVDLVTSDIVSMEILVSPNSVVNNCDGGFTVSCRHSLSPP